jgi:hypothetical protein
MTFNFPGALYGFSCIYQNSIFETDRSFTRSGSRAAALPLLVPAPRRRFALLLAPLQV